MVSWPWYTQTLPEQKKEKLSVLATMTVIKVIRYCHRMHGMKNYSFPILTIVPYLEVGPSKLAEGESADVLGQFSGRLGVFYQLLLHFCQPFLDVGILPL